MNNEITVKVTKEISVKISNGKYQTSAMIYKNGKSLKCISKATIDKAFSPEYRAELHAAWDEVAAAFVAPEAEARYEYEETYEDRLGREVAARLAARTPEEIAAHRAEMEEIETHQRKMARTMSVQG